MEVINLLTEYGANLKLRNSQGKIALDLAAPKSSVEQALLLHEGKTGLIGDLLLLPKHTVVSSLD